MSWNGLAISSFAKASKILKRESGITKYHFPVVGYDVRFSIFMVLEIGNSFLNCIYNQLNNHNLNTILKKVLCMTSMLMIHKFV